MFVSHTLRRPPARRGAILIVVLAMLALFAVVGLSFVLYADSQASTARQNVISENKDAPPDPFLGAELFTGSLVYGDTNELSALRGHSLAESRYGWDYDTNAATTQAGLLYTPFNGSGIPAETLAVLNQPGAWNQNIDRRQVLNHTRIVTNAAGTNWFVVDPQRASDPDGPGMQLGVVRDHVWTPPMTGQTVPGTFVSKAVPYTYADRANFYLAQMDPTTGRITVSSFHRPDVFTNTNALYTTAADQIAQSLNPNNPNWTTAAGRLLLVRPRPEDNRYDPVTKQRVLTGGQTDFPFPPANADGSFTGDVANMKFLTGSQRNDSVWMYTGAPVLEWRGRKYTTLVAPLVLDLNGRVNLSVAGNIRPSDPATIPGHPKHSSNHGLGAWEINPTALFPNAATANTDLLAILQRRFTAATMPAVGARPVPDYFYSSAYGRMNHPVFDSTLFGGTFKGSLPPRYAGIDPDGVSTTPVGTPDPITPPAATTAAAMPTYPISRYPLTQAQLQASGLVNHPSTFNPILWTRGSGPAAATPTHPFGLDDQIRLTARHTDPLNRYSATAVAAAAPGNLADPAVRAMSTLYGFTQQTAEVAVTATANPQAMGTTRVTRLGPIDVNRTLPEFRKNPLLPLSPLNMWDPTVLAELPSYSLARQARQTLARDVFVRLVALQGLIDGVNVFYEPESGYLVGPFDMPLGRHRDLDPAGPTYNTLRTLAQYAANAVDFIDNDDLNTTFVWNPDRSNPAIFPLITAPDPAFDPSWQPATGHTNLQAAAVGNRAVYGTELPRLVINEAYAALYNNRSDPNGLGRAANNLRKQFWVELYNPLSADPTLSENGGARLQYTAVTQVSDPSTVTNPTSDPTILVPCGRALSPYRVEIASQLATWNANTDSFTTFLAGNPANVAGDLPGGGTNGIEQLRLQVNDYTYAGGVAPGVAMGVDQYLVQPSNGAAAGVVAGNQGYFVLGPQDDVAMSKGTFPDAAMVPTVKLPDPPAGAGPHNAMAYETSDRTDTHITAEVAKRSTVVLRRLANPYLPFDPVTNPYITVDYAENLPTRDRVTHNDTGAHTAAAADMDGATAGRRHPYTTGPSFIDGTGANPEAWRTQASLPAGMATPKHSFFNVNDGVDNNRTLTGYAGAYGLEWLVHLDRHLINASELQHVSAQPPALLTHRYGDGVASSMTTATTYHLHKRLWTANMMAPPPYIPAAAPLLRDTVNFPNLYKAFDLLQAGSLMVGTPVGGRESGKLNVNTLNAERVVRAALDPNEGNAFTVTNPTLPAALWNGLTTATAFARTPNGTTPRTTTDETATGTDRPFKGFMGSGTFDDSLFRLTVPPAMGPGGVPILQATNPHPYFQDEPHRKLWNSTTTVSDSFLVVMTVGFFEVMNDGPHSVTNPPVLGKELFERIPGDLRAQFASVIDRTNITKEPAAYSLQSGVGLPQRQLKLLRDAHAGATQVTVEARPVGPNQFAIFDNGQTYTLDSTGATPIRLRLGYGEITDNTGDGETVTVATGTAMVPTVNQAVYTDPYTGTSTPIPGHVTLTLTGPLARYHGAGTRVGNSVIGHPGVQPTFTLLNPLYQQRYNGVVPYFTRLDP